MINKYISYVKKRLRIFISKWFSWLLFLIENFRINQLLKKNRNIILVYSIGKVGSSSVFMSLKHNKEIQFPIFHLHFLSAKNIKIQKEYYKSSARKSFPLHLIKSDILAKAITKQKTNVFVFCLIREPIKRELSSLFQDSFNFTNSIDLNSNRINEILLNKMKSLIDVLPEEEWFNNELKEVFGIDILSDDFTFDISKGYKVAANDNVRLALVRVENLNECFNIVSEELLGRKQNLKLKKSNAAESKFYLEYYQTIEKEVKFDAEQFDLLLNKKFIQKFYPDFIPKMKKKWIGKALT